LLFSTGGIEAYGPMYFGGTGDFVVDKEAQFTTFVTFDDSVFFNYTASFNDNVYLGSAADDDVVVHGTGFFYAPVTFNDPVTFLDTVELAITSLDLIAGGRIIPERMARLEALTSQFDFRYTVHGLVSSNFMEPVTLPYQLAAAKALVEVCDRIAARLARHIDEMNQDLGSFDVAQELIAEAMTFVGAFDQAGHVGHHKAAIAAQRDHAEIRRQRGEGIIRNLRLGR
jgi:hypothetical protein